MAISVAATSASCGKAKMSDTEATTEPAAARTTASRAAAKWTSSRARKAALSKEARSPPSATGIVARECSAAKLAELAKALPVPSKS